MRTLWMLILFLVACSRASEISPEPFVAPTPGTIAINKGSSTWEFREMPAEPTTPALLETDEGFALDPDWQIAEVEYDYDWGGLGFYRDKPNQKVIWNGDTFIRDINPITKAQMKSFVDSIVRFQSSQSYVSGNSWSDSYPSYSIQITGVDGQHIVITASSTGNPGDGPWNLIYNDQLFVQYDGTFGHGMEAIFDYRIGATREEMQGEFISETLKSTPFVSFSTRGLPPQLEYGFEGLFPIADAFEYVADPITGEIRGEIIGRMDYGEFEGEPIFSGVFAELRNLSISPSISDTIPCAIESITLPNREDRTGDAAWSFRCPMGAIAGYPSYRYQITAEMVDNDDKVVTLKGTLWGKWSRERLPIHLTLPSNLRTVLESNPPTAQLLADYPYVSAQYNANLDATAPFSIRSAGGEVTFYGTVLINSMPFPYQITTPFVITDDRLTYWELTPNAVSSFLEEVAINPSTQRLIAAFPDIQFKLVYSTGVEIPSAGMNNYRSLGFAEGTQLTEVAMVACGTVPPIRSPAFDMPYHTVGYHFEDGKSFINGIIRSGIFYPYGATLHLSESVPLVFLPTALNIDSPLTRGLFDFHYGGSGRWVRFGLPENATSGEKIKYQHIADVWNAELLTAFDTKRWLVKQSFTFDLTDSGDIQLVACE